MQVVGQSWLQVEIDGGPGVFWQVSAADENGTMNDLFCVWKSHMFEAKSWKNDPAGRVCREMEDRQITWPSGDSGSNCALCHRFLVVVSERCHDCAVFVYSQKSSVEAVG